MIKYYFTFALLCKHTYYFFEIAPCCTIFLPCPITRKNKTAPEPTWDRNKRDVENFFEKRSLLYIVI